MRDTQEHWHLDKRVPIALIVAMVGQFGAAMAYISAIAQRTSEHDRRLTVIEAQRIGERLAGLEAQMQDAKSLLLRIDGRLERIQSRER
jgi:hypothetical protein